MDQSDVVHTLHNGLRVVCRQSAGLVSYVGFVVNAGSRDESEDKFGLAHFVEHTLFKGTLRRKSWQISCRMEEVGGELNAYTSKEETMVYTNAPSGYEERTFDLLSDIVTRSNFPAVEIDREREVVIEEINSYLDSPSDSVYDEFEELAYAGSGLAHNILGSPGSVRNLKGEDCRKFLDMYYTPANMVVYCCSPVSPERIIRLAEKYFSGLHYPSTPHSRLLPPEMMAFDEIRDKGNHQANTMVGTRVFGRNDDRRYALFLLNNYLGGPGMNSRLNREIRDKKGYAYTVESNVALMSDSGLFSVYFGSDPSVVGKCRKIIDDEIDRLAQTAMTSGRFEKVKRQYCGQLLVSSDHIESRAMSMGKSLLYYGNIHDMSVVAERIMAVTAEDMRNVAQLVASSPKGCLTLV